jgi:hypothetical protein
VAKHPFVVEGLPRFGVSTAETQRESFEAGLDGLPVAVIAARVRCQPLVVARELDPADAVAPPYRLFAEGTNTLPPAMPAWFHTPDRTGYWRLELLTRVTPPVVFAASAHREHPMHVPDCGKCSSTVEAPEVAL